MTQKIDMTMMYATHDALRRDLRYDGVPVTSAILPPGTIVTFSPS